MTVYYLNGTISYSSNIGDVNTPQIIYRPDDTAQYENGTLVTGKGNISQFEPYQKLWDSRPLQTYAEAADLFTGNEQHVLGTLGNQSSIKLFTSDYALYWYDYQGGYDVVLSELGWNQSTTQNIALVRGAADMQNKSWGTVIDWASLTAPYLQSSSQMYNQMCQSYRSGATYVVVFNYSPSGNGTGLLQDNDFAALQKFWKNVVENPKETNNFTAQDALVLPQNYGGGMRNQNDTVWGIWQADSTSQQIWANLQTNLSKHGSKLDVIYDNPAYPTAGRYQHVYYWNQTA